MGEETVFSFADEEKYDEVKNKKGDDLEIDLPIFGFDTDGSYF